MRLVATVIEVRQRGIHRVAALVDGKPVRLNDMPDARTVEITSAEKDGSGCILVRYSEAGKVCGDTWHATLADAFHQADFEYGLQPDDFKAAE